MENLLSLRKLETTLISQMELVNTMKGFDQREFGLRFSFVKHILLLEFLCP